MQPVDVRQQGVVIPAVDGAPSLVDADHLLVQLLARTNAGLDDLRVRCERLDEVLPALAELNRFCRWYGA